MSALRIALQHASRHRAPVLFSSVLQQRAQCLPRFGPVPACSVPRTGHHTLRTVACAALPAKKKAPFPITGDLDLPYIYETVSDSMAEKRKAGEPLEKAGKSAKGAVLCNRKRVRTLKVGDIGDGPVVYWMSRDQRMKDNWALIYALEQAEAAGTNVAVVFNLVDKFLGAGARQFGFMLRGLKEMAPKLDAANIRFYLVQGEPSETVPELLETLDAGLLVTDFSPLRLGLQWRAEVTEKVWEASDKREYAARTIRRKIHSKLPDFLEQFPALPEAKAWEGDAPAIEWDDIIANALEVGKAVPEVSHLQPGEEAAWEALTGPKGFLSKERLKTYDEGRNDPNRPQALSGMSPYFHFGQLAPQRAALEAIKHKKTAQKAVECFLEEAVVRRELSDNFCFYEPKYDSLECAADWAKDSLQLHASDKRDFVYTLDELEKGKTHDDLWNAAQLEMVHQGKMHGFMRMYWAKKILEWTESPEQALEFAIGLNDKWELDGRDPNGYVGCMWSICGIHDQGWAERAVFGKIRFMNYKGCKRKFNVDAYVAKVKRDTLAGAK